MRPRQGHQGYNKGGVGREGGSSEGQEDYQRDKGARVNPWGQRQPVEART